MLKGLREQKQTNESCKLRIRIAPLTYAAQAWIRGEDMSLKISFQIQKQASVLLNSGESLK